MEAKGAMDSKEQSLDIGHHPTVTVVVLAYNGIRYIPDLLASLADQTYPSEQTQILVVDNASTDGTAELVARDFPDVTLVCMKTNLGYAEGNNAAVPYANGELIAFQNQDTVCHRRWLEALVDGIGESLDIGLCGANVIHVDLKQSALDREGEPLALSYCDMTPFGFGRFYESPELAEVAPGFVSGCSFIIRRATLDELGELFDGRLGMYVEDTDLSLRLVNAGYRLRVLRGAVVYHDGKDDRRIRPGKLKMASRALRNRVVAFYKNMTWVEFVVFYPLLLLGSPLKLREITLTPAKKAFFVLPFMAFSMGCILLALFGLRPYSKERKRILGSNPGERRSLLSFVLGLDARRHVQRR